MLPVSFLESIGATAAVQAAFAPHAAQGLTLARISVSIRDEYRVLTASGELRAEPSGLLLYTAASRADLPAAGDWVAVRLVDRDQAIVHAVLPRRTRFSRRAAGEREDEQIIAANIDVVFLVTGLDRDFNLRRVERYLTLACESGAQPVIVLNKTDLCGDVEARVRSVRDIAPGIEVIAISARSALGIEPLLGCIAPGRTVALIGSSGAGKSTLLNVLLGEDRMRTQDVRESDSRGRHTTTHRELIPLPQGGVLIDSPGMRELQMWASQDSLDEAFDEIAAIAANCRFHDCSHDSEPGCAVREALASGALDSGRWESYLKLRREIRHHELRTDVRAAAVEKQKWKTIHKAMRHHPKYRG
jgi:ribosome biogenesis GTPase